MQVITCFVGNTDHQIKKRERFEIRTRFPASVAVNGRQPQISRIVKNRNLSRSNSLQEMWQSCAATIAENIRDKEYILRSNFVVHINSPPPEETPKLRCGILASKFWSTHRMWIDSERIRKQSIFCSAELGVEVPNGIPGNRIHVGKPA